MEPCHIISIDEHQTEAGEGSSGHDRPAITMEERFTNLMKEGDEARAVKAPRTNRPPAKIQKVIFLLEDHEHFVKYFKPRVASLGPIHHGKPKYQLGEKYKLKLAYEFVQGFEKNINLLYEVEKNIKQLRECYEEEVTKKYNDKELAWMLFVDGCAILQYIFYATNESNDKFKESNIKADSAAFAQQDLFLLENQVPYCLLILLMNSSGKVDDLRRSIENFIRNVMYQQTEPQQNVTKGGSSHDLQPQPKETDPTHLLDLLRTKLLGPPPESPKPNPSSGKTWTGLLSVCHTPFRKMCIKKQDRDWQSYRNVQELKAAGIQMKCGKNSNLRDISFTRQCGFYPGYLWLPPITVDDSTGPKFMNLIAYEMCLDFENDFGITSYISFLDSLIDEPNDVKELRKARVLHNFLGSDQEVADLFNKIGTDLVPNDEAYKDVKFQIQGYYDNNWMTWMAQFFHNHFSSPWAIIALFGILFGLGLSTIQTWYAVNSPPGPCDDFCKKLP